MDEVREVLSWLGAILFVILFAGFMAYFIRDAQIADTCDAMGRVQLRGHVYQCIQLQSGKSED